MKEREEARGIGIDLSGILDRDEYYYIDSAHVSPNANRLIAEGIWKAMSAPVQSSSN